MSDSNLPAHPHQQHIDAVRSLAWLFDNLISIPRIKFWFINIPGGKFGIDPLLGAVPGAWGDILPTGFSIYAAYVAYRVGVPHQMLKKLAWRILRDLGIGLIPIVGDAVDFKMKPIRYADRLIAAQLEAERQRIAQLHEWELPPASEGEANQPTATPP